MTLVFAYFCIAAILGALQLTAQWWIETQADECKYYGCSKDELPLAKLWAFILWTLFWPIALGLVVSSFLFETD